MPARPHAQHMNDIDLGVVLPTGIARWGIDADSRELIRFARRAEDLGFASVWTGDTLLRPIIEPLTMLSAVAAVTERITIGTATLLPALRRPVQAAHALASLDQLSGGRLTLAVGAGFPNRSEKEYAAAGVPWPRRFARLDETVELWRSLWGPGSPESFHGEVLQFDELAPALKPVRPDGPPIWLGGASPTALARAGRMYDGWLPYLPTADAYRAGLDSVRAAAPAPDAVTPALFVTVLITDEAAAGREALDAYVRASYRMPLEVVETIQLLIAGPAEMVAERLSEYVAAGARHLVCRLAVPDMAGARQQLELLRKLR
jgi:alkanesulfonate monooxygenase SsuD/methylene tetrahydromethanopterin reductase-like flavin-dependent oxidoreductase (luciferase family)